MMSEAERKAHHERMHGLKTYEECKVYMEKHHEEMAAREGVDGLSVQIGALRA